MENEIPCPLCGCNSKLSKEPCTWTYNKIKFVIDYASYHCSGCKYSIETHVTTEHNNSLAKEMYNDKYIA